MTRSILAIVSALFAATAFFASAAQACISCSYVPPVVNTPVYSHGGGYHHSKTRTYRAAKAHRARKAKRHIVESAPKAKKVQAAKIASDTKPATTTAVKENSSISIAKTDVAPSDTDAPETTGSTDADTEAKVSCKKFFPSVGMTLTVPCD